MEHELHRAYLIRNVSLTAGARLTLVRPRRGGLNNMAGKIIGPCCRRCRSISSVIVHCLAYYPTLLLFQKKYPLSFSHQVSTASSSPTTLGTATAASAPSRSGCSLPTCPTPSSPSAPRPSASGGVASASWAWTSSPAPRRSSRHPDSWRPRPVSWIGSVFFLFRAPLSLSR